MILYCISGLGVDHRVFSKLTLSQHELRFIHWKSLLRNEDLPSYAKRLGEEIDTTKPFGLIGFSFGGMCVTEISKILRPEKTIIIASAKSYLELPWRIKIFNTLPFHKYAPENYYMILAWHLRSLYGIKDKDDSEIYYSMIHSMPDNFRKRAADAIIKWRNTEYPEMLHIHGDSDVVIPFKKNMNAVKIKGGTHFMTLTHPTEISELINNYLK
jgi:pimeloyl-ACP methyl ester carboxylesterase